MTTAHSKVKNPLMRRGAWWLFAAALALGAFFFRYPGLAERPMHTDEAVHAAKLGILLETGRYEYDPHEYHGPVIYYAALPFVWGSGAKTLAQISDEVPLRLPIIVFGALLVLATALSAGSLGQPEAAFAALLLAVSPAFSFYSRYYIQEVPFTLFCFLTLGAAWRLLETHRVAWALGAGLAFGTTVALKETWIMVMGTAALAGVLLHLTSTRRPWPLPFPWRRFYGLFALAGVVSLLTSLAMMSNFFRNPRAIIDTFAAMLGYVARGVSGDSSTFGTAIHDHPWYYYLQLLAWPSVDGPWLWAEGGTLLLGCIGIAAVIRRWPAARGVWHFIVIFTVLITAFYSAIPYKTPWNVLPLLMAWCLLAGRGFAALVRLAGSRKWLAAVIGIALMAWPALLAMQSYRATILRPADTRNPYAYSATSPNLRRLEKRADQLAAVAPEGKQMLIQIISPANDYWPLPWYLRRFDNIGYYTDFESVRPDAAMIISSTDPDESTLAGLASRQTEYYGLRAETILTTLIRQDLWDAFMTEQMENSSP